MEHTDLGIEIFIRSELLKKLWKLETAILFERVTHLTQEDQSATTTFISAHANLFKNELIEVVILLHFLPIIKS